MFLQDVEEKGEINLNDRNSRWRGGVGAAGIGFPDRQIGESFRLLSRLAGAFNMSRAQASDQCLVECLPIASMQMWR